MVQRAPSAEEKRLFQLAGFKLEAGSLVEVKGRYPLIREPEMVALGNATDIGWKHLSDGCFEFEVNSPFSNTVIYDAEAMQHPWERNVSPTSCIVQLRPHAQEAAFIRFLQEKKSEGACMIVAILWPTSDAPSGSVTEWYLTFPESTVAAITGTKFWEQLAAETEFLSQVKVPDMATLFQGLDYNQSFIEILKERTSLPDPIKHLAAIGFAFRLHPLVLAFEQRRKRISAWAKSLPLEFWLQVDQLATIRSENLCERFEEVMRVLFVGTDFEERVTALQEQFGKIHGQEQDELEVMFERRVLPWLRNEIQKQSTTRPGTVTITRDFILERDTLESLAALLQVVVDPTQHHQLTLWSSLEATDFHLGSLLLASPGWKVEKSLVYMPQPSQQQEWWLARRWLPNPHLLPRDWNPQSLFVGKRRGEPAARPYVSQQKTAQKILNG